MRAHRHPKALAAAAASVLLLAGAPAATGHVVAGPAAVLSGGSAFWKPARSARVSRYEVSAVRIGHFAYILGGIPHLARTSRSAPSSATTSTPGAPVFLPVAPGRDRPRRARRRYQGDLIAVGRQPRPRARPPGRPPPIADVYRYDTARTAGRADRAPGRDPRRRRGRRDRRPALRRRAARARGRARRPPTPSRRSRSTTSSAGRW